MPADAVTRVPVLRAAERWLFAPGDARRLVAVRTGLSLLLAWRLSRGVYLALAGQPEALFRPISFMRVFGAMPGRGVVLAVQIAGVAAALAAAARLRPRVTLPVAWAAGVFLGGMHTSIGKVMHNELLLLLALVPFLFAPDPRGARGRSVRLGWPVRTAMAAVALVYLFTGLAKLVESGPAWVTSDNLRWALYASSETQAAPNPVALFVADRPVLARLAAAGILAIELGFPVALVSAVTRRAFVAGAVAFHAGTWLAMGLDYWAWVGTVLVVFVDWPGLARRLASSRSRPAGEQRKRAPV